MSRVLWVDASQGASGDMILGALVDAGVPLARVRRALESLPLEGWTLRGRRIERAALTARKIDVRVRGNEPGRGLRALARIVRAGDLPERARERALAVFRRLVEAEAEVHGCAVEQVHLHEAGGTDAIVDVVGAAVALEHLDPARIVVSTMTTGFGEVRCAHGVYPVPAPATALLVRGAPVRAGEIEVERLTPTGAAILTTLVDDWGPLPPMRPAAVGLGAGDRDLGDVPNMLRVILGEALEPTPPTEGDGGHVVVIECNVDESTPQALAFAAERLLAAGALDVFTLPAAMKKGRLGHQLTVLARPERLGAMTEAVLAHTTTLGLRYRFERRIELRRSVQAVRTPYGRVRVKVGELDGAMRRVWPEYEDCAALATRRGVSLTQVQHAALRAFDERPTSGARAPRGKRRRS